MASMSAASAWTQPWHPEWQLARGVPPTSREDAPVLADVVQGELTQVLRSPTARAMLAPIAQALQTTLQGASSSKDVVVPFNKVSVPLPGSKQEVLGIAVASLHAFVQLNWTGPALAMQPIDWLRACVPQAFGPRSVDEEEEDAMPARVLHASSLEYLTYHGEPAYHLCEGSFYLVFSLLALDALHKADAASTLPSLPWWRLRARSVHLRILDEAVECEASLMHAVDAMAEKMEAHAAKASSQDEKYAWDALRSRVILETALAYQRAGHDRTSSERLIDAAKANGLVYELSGALGKRTKWQKEAKTQLVLLAESREAGADRADETTPATKKDTEPNPVNSGWQASVDPEKQVDHQPATYSLNDDTLLEQTQFTSTAPGDGAGSLSHLQPGAQPPLAVTDQCTLLALCLNIHNTQASHGLTSEQMSAFVERVISHPQNWSVHTMSLLLRSRLEAARTRTVERSTLQLQALIDQMPTNDSSLRERLRFFHALELPAKWAMQAELARRFVSLGVLRSALEIFEQIELWEDVVQCLGLLGQQEEGIEVVRDLLEGRKTEADVQLQEKRIATAASRVPRTRFVRARAAKLWCLLGDLQPAEAESHYLQAWDVSGSTSARAARSLGGYHFALSAFDQASMWLRRAVRINALYTRSWFMLGCSYMRQEKWLEGAAAFRKCTSLEEEDGESWNNLASCYLRMHATQVPRLDTVLEEAPDDEESNAASVGTAHDSGVSVMSESEDDEGAAALSTSAITGTSEGAFELRLLAHKALGISLKYQFESWRVWANYMVVSIDVGMLREATRAFARVIEIRFREASSSAATAGDAKNVVDLDVLNKLVDAVIRAPAADEDPSTRSTDIGEALRPAVTRLFQDTLLPRFSTDAAIWQSYARLLFSAGEYRDVLQARVQSFQCGLGDPESTDVVTDKRTWALAVEELQELCDVLMNLGDQAAAPGQSEAAMPDWKFRARTLVRNFMARTRDSFEDEPEWESLTDLMTELKRSE